MTEDWEPLAPPEPPPEHKVVLWCRIEDGRQAAVGSARSMRDVPSLLRMIADRWEAACPEAESADAPEGP